MSLAISAVDMAIVAVYMGMVVALGVVVGRSNRTAADYMLGGRSLPWWAVLVSIVATETSTATFLSVPGMSWRTNCTFLQLAIGYVLGRYVIAATFLPLYFKGELFTAYQVLHDRFGGATQRCASLIFIVTRTLADGLRLYLTAIVVREVTDLDIPTSCVVVGAVTVAYTLFGGMKAVVWTDFVQFFIYMAGAVLACYIAMANLPAGEGISAFWTFAQEKGKFAVFNFSSDWTDPFTFWAGVFGGGVLSMATHGTDQLMVQRYLSARNQSEAWWALTLSGWVVLAQFCVFLFLGVELAFFYQQYPPATAFTNGDRVFPSFIVNQMPIGVVGIVLAAVFAAAMSTLSGSLNSSATAFVTDLWPSSSQDAGHSASTVTLTKVMTVVFGVAQVSVALAGPSLPDNVVNNVLKIAGFTTGLVLGLFFLGIRRTPVRQAAALSALLIGFGVVLSVWWFTPIAWPWYAPIGSSTTYVAGMLLNRLLPSRT